MELKIEKQTVEAKEREIKPMRWWYVYKFFDYVPPKWYVKIFIKIEKFVRFIFRKPVPKVKPKFEVDDIKMIRDKDLDKELIDILDYEFKHRLKEEDKKIMEEMLRSRKMICTECKYKAKTMEGPYCNHPIIRQLHEEEKIEGYDDMLPCKNGKIITPAWCPYHNTKNKIIEYINKKNENHL